MPLENSLNVTPYFDDYDETKQFYRVLFKPGVSVQARELNQLQTMMQNQVEKFGNHVFKSGTIVSGINFSYLPNYSYIKILDTQIDGQPSIPSEYVGLNIKSNLNLTARVVNYEEGLESKTPDLKTLYLQYTNSSDPDTANSDAVYTTFGSSQVLTVFDVDYPIFEVTINNGGVGFANSDSVVISSSLIITGNTGAFSNGETITQATTGAKAVIAAINTTAVADTTIIKIRPRTADLTNNQVTSTAWSFSAGYNITGGSSGSYGTVSSLIGSGATGLLTTDSEGIIQDVIINNGGEDYTFLPTVYVKTSNATATVNNLDIVPQNYLTQITTGTALSNPVGAGYAFAVTEGIIYQKGLFLTVDAQTLIVDKYTTEPNNVSVGFKTIESYVDSNEDSSLFDNALGSPNYTAPGADRLKLTPVLYKTDIETAAANVDFFALAEWKDGYPYKENRTTVYSAIAEEAERRTRETSGDFVVDPFNFGSREKETANTTHFDLVIDPGLAYIQGQRIETKYNNYLDVKRANTVSSLSNQKITFNYGSYIRVNELAGHFNFKAGDTVSLRDTAMQYITTKTISTAAGVSAPGAEIGTARMRSLVVESGIPGTAECVYRMYLFDIIMSQGCAFKNVRSVFYNGTTVDGIADLALEYNATSASNEAIVKDPLNSTMVFPLRQGGTKTVSDISFKYRTTSTPTLQMTSSVGEIAIGPLATGLTFPYSAGTLSSTQKKEFIVVPVTNAQAVANITGSSFGLLNACTVVTGTGTAFASDVKVGDFLKFSNSTASVVHQVFSIANNTQLTLKTAAAAAMTAANATIFFPALYPIPLESRDARTITIGASQDTASINVGVPLTATVNVVATYNISKNSATPVPKTVVRDVFVKIHTSNNAGLTTGPWSLGVPGVVRLKNVYVGNSTHVNTSSTDITKYFFIDSGEDEHAYRMARLAKKPSSTYALNNNAYVLIKFDAFTTGGAEGFFTIGSYSINDTAALADSASTINTLEIPELTSTKGIYYDLRDVFDFRPYGSNTAALATTVAGATINPANTFTLSGDDQFFPVPDSEVTYDMSYYLPRTDRVVLDKTSTFKVKAGTPSNNPVAPAASPGEVTLATLRVPAYPSIPRGLNTQTLEFADRRIGSIRGPVNARLTRFGVTGAPLLTEGPTQPQRYTMSDIGRLERRIDQLEYQASLNQAEQGVKDKTIPSGITPSTSRFKNGFFVDTFDSAEKTDTSASEYAATIDGITGTLKPKISQVNFESIFDMTHANTAADIVDGRMLMLPFDEVALITQTIKTSLINSDGFKTSFTGSGTITPPTFRIQTKSTVVTTPSGGSAVSSSSAGDGTGGGVGSSTGCADGPGCDATGTGSTGTGDTGTGGTGDGTGGTGDGTGGGGDGE